MKNLFVYSFVWQVPFIAQFPHPQEHPPFFFFFTSDTTIATKSATIIKSTIIVAGFIMSIGVVVPGVSSSVLLMLLGIYDIYLFAVSTIDLTILIPMAIGLLVGGIIFLEIIKFCLEHFHIQTYYCIIGFVLGSIPILYPGIEFNLNGVISMFMFILGLYIAQILEKAH